MKSRFPKPVVTVTLWAVLAASYANAAETWQFVETKGQLHQRHEAAFVEFEGKFYVISGIVNGHIDGWVKWADEYDPNTGQWRLLPAAPRAMALRPELQRVRCLDRFPFPLARKTGSALLPGFLVIANPVDQGSLESNVFAEPLGLIVPVFHDLLSFGEKTLVNAGLSDERVRVGGLISAIRHINAIRKCKLT